MLKVCQTHIRRHLAQSSDVQQFILIAGLRETWREVELVFTIVNL